MAILKTYSNKKIAIYGMGLTGLSTAKTLKNSKAKIFCWDDNKKIRKKIKKMNIPLTKFWSSKDRMDKIVISPGIDINKCKIKKYLKKNIKNIITDLDLFFELNKEALIISITGTNGKSTTCKIIEKILKTGGHNVKTVGNIGNPILSTKMGNKKCVIIIEASSYQLQYSKLFRSKHAAILNISPDHLERHKNIKNYTKVKSKIFFAQKSTDYSYINLKNKYSKSIQKIFKNKKLKSKLISIDKSICNSLLKKIHNRYFNSEGNIENLAFAYKISKSFKINDSTIIQALINFKGLPHRQELIFSSKRMICINDSKATSFDACKQSLSNYNNIYWIVGGLPKKNDHFNLRKVSKKIKKAYIIGKNTSFFSKQIKRSIPYVISRNISNAITHILLDIKKNKNIKNTILLSPAAASFDQFNNFEERGSHFKKLAISKIKRLSYV